MYFRLYSQEKIVDTIHDSFFIVDQNELLRRQEDNIFYILHGIKDEVELLASEASVIRND